MDEGTGSGVTIDLGWPRRIHLVGAGGAGMSAIGTVLLAMGHVVSGSDAVASAALERLGGLGAEVHVGHDEAWVGDAEIVARSTAIPADNPELSRAEGLGLPLLRRSEILAAICARCRTLAVSGTHGKTTTSAMLAYSLREADLHPSMIIGGDIAGIGGGAVWDPEGEWLVVEADESDGTFLALGAHGTVVTSVEPDHLDFYGSEEAMRAAFERFVRAAPGPAVVCADDPGAAALRSVARPADFGRLVSYGTSRLADVRIEDVDLAGTGARFSLSVAGRPVGRCKLSVPGLHNVRNAAAAMTLANALGVPWEVAMAGVGHYGGVARRFELRGERAGVTYIDDYGHLPTEVAAVLAAARTGGWSRVVAVFQPHRYSRTESLWRDFGDSFEDSDILVVTDVYPAGEEPRPGISGELVVRAVRDRHPDSDVRYAPTLGEAARLLRELLQPGDLCLTMGAGDLTTLPDMLLGGGPGGGTPASVAADV